MSTKASKNRKINWLRIFFSIIYFCASIILFLIFRDNIFYFEIPKNSWNFYRLIWCYCSVSLGFALVAFAFMYHESSPLPKYLTHYPLQLLVMATLVYSILQIFPATSGYLFYYLSFSLCFTLGFMVDRYWGIIESIVGKLGK